jgi:hypothetical protein
MAEGGMTAAGPGDRRGAGIIPAGSAANVIRSEQVLLGIYLNDHLAAATTAGLELARRAAASHRGSDTGERLARFAADVAADRGALRSIMAALGAPVRHYKSYAAWVAEKAARLKLNGSLRSRSPLSSVVELEMLRLGVEGKAAAWRTLRALAERDTRLDKEQLNELLSRAAGQSQALEELRTTAASKAFAHA